MLVEKPMCARVDEARELVAVAERMKRVLMVNSAVDKLKELKSSGALGKTTYYDSLRVNLFQPDMNVLWDLAPHLASQPKLDVAGESTAHCLRRHQADLSGTTWISPMRRSRFTTAVSSSDRKTSA